MGIVGPGISDSSKTVPFTNTSTIIGDAFTLTAKAQPDNNGYDCCQKHNTQQSGEFKYHRERHAVI